MLAKFILPLLEFLSLLLTSDGTARYYGAYLLYGSGETYVTAPQNHGGPNLPLRKWNVECLDGEAMTGLQDFNNNFERVSVIKCSFSFPNKPPSQGRYPYFPTCHVRNFTNQYHCFDPQNTERTLNTFMTGLWDNDFQFFLFRVPNDEATSLYKCCKTPAGYYIDYVSCYYMPTHDVYWEYYDSPIHFVTLCSTGYIATGISKKINPGTGWYNVEWIQCCRLGFGPPVALPPPVVHIGKDRTPVYYSQSAVTRPQVPPAYQVQYRSDQITKADFNNSFPEWKDQAMKDSQGKNLHPWSARYKSGKLQESITHKFKADLRLGKS